MARHEFGASMADYVVQPSDGLWGVAPLAALTFWDAADGGIQYTDLLDSGGLPTTQVVTDEHGAIPEFQSPDGVLGMWADAGGTGRSWIATRDFTSSPTASVDWIVVTDPLLGAAGDGVRDDTGSIQAAIDMATTAESGTVYIPHGTYLLSGPLLLPAGVAPTIIGSGWASVLKLAADADCYAIEMSGDETRVAIRDLTIDGNHFEQSGASESGGIYGAGAVACRFDNLHFTACRDNGLVLGPQTTAAFGHNNRVVGCLFDNSEGSTGPGRGIHMDSSDENQIVTCDFEFLGGSGGTGATAAAMILDQAGTQFILGCNFVNGGNDTKGVRIQDAHSTKVECCNFDGLPGDNIYIVGQRNIVLGNSLFSPGIEGTAGQASGIYLEFGTADNVISNNVIRSAPGAGTSRGAIREAADGGGGNNTITENRISTDGTWSFAALDLSGTGSRVVGNQGGGPDGDRPTVVEGTDASMGVATLVAGTVTVVSGAVSATSRIFLTRQAAGGTLGHLTYTRDPGVGFTITSTSAADTSTVEYLIVQPT